MSPLAQTTACQNLPLAGRVSHFIKLGDNHTGPLGPQLRKGLHNKPTEQASPTCLSQGAKLLKRGNSEPLQGGSEHYRKECNIQSLQRTGRFPFPTVHGSKERWGTKAHQPEKAQLLCTNGALQNGGHSYQRLKDLLKPGDWMTKVDLKDAYFMIPVATNHRSLLQFKWLGETYQFNCLPFGLLRGSFIKTTKPIVAILRTTGLRIIIYIDDILILSETESLSREQTTGLVFLLENLGFIINYPKSILKPSKKIEFLGFIVDSTTMEIKLPGRNQEDKDGNQEIQIPGQSSSHNPVKTTGQTQSCHTCNPTCSPILPQPTVSPTRSPGGRQPKLFNTGQTNSGMLRGTGLVGEASDRQSLAHKLPRTSSSNTGCQMLCQRQGEYCDPSNNGQHHC